MARRKKNAAGAASSRSGQIGHSNKFQLLEDDVSDDASQADAEAEKEDQQVLTPMAENQKADAGEEDEKWITARNTKNGHEEHNQQEAEKETTLSPSSIQRYLRKDEVEEGSVAGSTSVSTAASAASNRLSLLCPKPKAVSACDAIIPKWTEGCLFTAGPTEILRKALTTAGVLLHHVVAAQFKLEREKRIKSKGQYCSKLKFKVTDEKQRIFVKEDNKHGLRANTKYGVSALHPVTLKGELFLTNYVEFSTSKCREVWDVSRLLQHLKTQDHFYKEGSKFGSETGTHKLQQIRNLCHRAYLQNAKTDPLGVHMELMKHLWDFLRMIQTIVSDEMLKRFESQKIDVSELAKYKKEFMGFCHTYKQMEKMASPGEFDVLRTLKALAQSIEEEDKDGANPGNAATLVLSFIGSRLQQHEKLAESTFDVSTEDDFALKVRQRVVKEGKDVKFPVRSKTGEREDMLNDPLAKKNEDLVNNGFDALSMILSELLSTFGQTINFEHEAFHKLQVPIISSETNMYELTELTLQHLPIDDRMLAFDKIKDPAKLLEVAQKLWEDHQQQNSKDEQDSSSCSSDDGIEMQVVGLKCKDLYIFCSALSHHILKDEGEQLRKDEAARALWDMISVANGIEKICSTRQVTNPPDAGRTLTCKPPWQKYLVLLKLIFNQFNTRKSTYDFFRYRERLQQIEGNVNRKAVNYLRDRLIPCWRSMQTSEQEIVSAQLRRLPQHVLQSHTTDDQIPDGCSDDDRIKPLWSKGMGSPSASSSCD